MSVHLIYVVIVFIFIRFYYLWHQQIIKVRQQLFIFNHLL